MISTRRSSAALLALALLGTLGLGSGCGAFDGNDSSPGNLGRRLAGALSGDDLSEVPFFDRSTDQVATAYQSIVAGMGDIRPEVEAGAVEDDGERLTVDLDWSWTVAARTWDYRSTATLIKTSAGWQVRWAASIVHPRLTEGERLDATPILAERGHVLGADGAAIVVPRDVSTFGIDRSRVSPEAAAGSARAVAELVDITPEPYAERVLASGPDAFVPAITLRRDAVPAAVASQVMTIAGARRVDGALPLAPTKEFAAPILGSVGDVTAEMIDEHPDRYRIGDQAGMSGLQARYDDTLRGSGGAVVNRVGPDTEEHELFRVGAEPGAPLRLTLDVELQSRAEELLASVAPASALVAVRPSDGDILVAANGPGNEGYNYATFGQIAPGSTFKAVSALALLRGDLAPDDALPCPPTLAVDGKSFKNYSDYPSSALGSISFETAFANSCNTSFVSQAGAVSNESLAQAASDLGVGVDRDLGFPAFLGTVPRPATATEHAADLIGQGGILMSPLSMAVVAASAQAGRTVQPRLLVTASDSDPTAEPGLGADEASDLRALMRAVVTHGSGAFLADVPGADILAKTGTAEFERDGNVLTHAWMIAAQGDLAVAVFVDVGDSGSHTAGPILQQFLRDAQGDPAN